MEYSNEEPVSPTGQYLNSKSLSLCVLGVLELAGPVTVDDSQVQSLVNELFLPTNPRFSSIMVEDDNGDKRWKKVDVNIKDHIKVPEVPTQMSQTDNRKYIDDYISYLGMEKLPKHKPMWEIHILTCPTSNEAEATVIFKLHHSLGDGFSLVGALLSCLQRADDPSLPLTFPTAPPRSSANNSWFKSLNRVFSVVGNTVSDFCLSMVKSSFIEDDKSPIRSGVVGVEFKPLTTASITLSIDRIKNIKTSMGSTINDVVAGTIFLGTRLYMKEKDNESMNSKSTVLVLFNTREFRSYVPVKEMLKPKAKTPWGNYFAFMHVPIPSLDVGDDNPLQFVHKARQMIDAKKNSLGSYLTGRFLQILGNLRGPEAAAKFIHGTLKKTSMAITNVVGPVEQMCLANYPVTGVYFVVAGAPQSLSIPVISYMGKVRVCVVAEKGFIDTERLKECIEEAFDKISQAACGSQS